MKHLFSTIVALLFLSGTTFAQCDLQNVVINITGSNQLGTDCSVDFNMSFRLKNNGGNKTVVIQAWKESQYPAFWGTACTGNRSPKAADLRLNGTGELPVLNIAFDISTQTVINSISYPGGGVTLGSGYTVQVGALDAQGYYPITLNNLNAVFPNQQCGTGVTLRADVWSSQASLNSQWTPHCIICNNVFAFNYPVVSAQLNCLVPRGYFVRIQNINTLQTVVSSWKAYMDMDNDAVLDPTDPLVDDQSGTLHTITPGTAYSSGFIPYTNNTTAPYLNKNLIIEVTTEGLANKQYALAGNSCVTLPVDFRSFTASRTKENVNLRWETSTEQNSAAFVVERMVGQSGWQTIVVIPSKATGGNSNELLTYTYTDLNNFQGISQYRIRQVDKDNLSRYSEVKAIRGEAQPMKLTVYPNPSDNGKVNVVFAGPAMPREVTLCDLSGRVVRKFPNVTNTNLEIDNLATGFYSLRVFAPESGEQNVTKLIVNRK